jgi:hypothetical protein
LCAIQGLPWNSKVQTAEAAKPGAAPARKASPAKRMLSELTIAKTSAKPYTAPAAQASANAGQVDTADHEDEDRAGFSAPAVTPHITAGKPPTR